MTQPASDLEGTMDDTFDRLRRPAWNMQYMYDDEVMEQWKCSNCGHDTFWVGKLQCFTGVMCRKCFHQEEVHSG